MLKSMRYCAVGVGRSDHFSLDRYVAAAKDAGIPVVNVCAKDRDGVVPYVIKQVGGLRVGILSYGFAPPEQDGLDLRKRRYLALKEAREKSDFLILMDEGNVANEDWIKRQAERWGAPDVIMGNMSAFSLGSQTKVVGKSWILPSTPQTKSVGVLEVKVEPGKDPQMKFSQSFLNEDIAEDETIKKALEEYAATEKKRSEAMSAAMNQRMLESSGKPPAAPNPGAAGSTARGAYYDSRTCVACHKSQHESWAASKHASAVKPLIDKGRDIPACLDCHSEWYRQTGAYLPVDERSKLGVECASCHGKVLPHGEAGPDKSVAGPRIDLDTCRACHKPEHSPDFEKKSKEYWKKASHKPVKST